jgi:hypothetical protein
MRRAFAFVIAFLLVAGGGLSAVAQTPSMPTQIMMAPGENYRITCQTAFVETFYQAQPGVWEVACMALPPGLPTATPTNTPPPPAATATHTHTPVPPTATNTPTPPPGSVTLGWHPPGAHDGLNPHEHGDQPPSWVTGAFDQVRESHTGYKGALATSPGGVQSYFIGHIIATEFARSHGDHDYQLWLRDPETGAVFFVEGILHFGEDEIVHTSPIIERTTDTGERPIALAERSPTDGCETWYNRPGVQLADIGWTICGRYQRFDGTVTGLTGHVRTVDWIIPCDRLPADNPMLNNCRTEFGVSRLSFLVNTRDYDPAGVVAPIN